MRAADRPEFRSPDGTPRTWKLVGVEQREPISLGGGHFHPNTTTCDRCGQCIRWVATMESSDGETLRTGMDCAGSLAGGPSEMELRRAQRAYQNAQYAKAHAARWAAERAERDAARRIVAEENAQVYAQVMADLAEVAASEKCSSWERNFAGNLLAGLKDGSATGDLEVRERSILRRALRAARAPASSHYGQVGARLKNVEAVVERCVYMGSFIYGSRWALSFRLPTGEVLVWKTGVGAWCDELAGNKDELDGTRVRISFTVKQHAEFRGTPQTEIGNAKIEGLGCGFFYANFDVDAMRSPGFDLDLLQPQWARNVEEAEAKFAAGSHVYGPFRTTTELYDAQRGDEEHAKMVASLREWAAA